MSNCQSVVASVTCCLRNNSEDEDLVKRFWQQWQQYRDYLYRCCLKWMGGNSTDAEDALSRAMLKAWEKVQKYVEEIANFKAWLTRLTHNLCVDIHRERDRSTNRVENIEVYASNEEQGLVRSEDTPESAMETGEKTIVIRRAIDNLPTRLRETFILHFYQELSYQEIAQQQEISYQNVCKRISQARAILREELREYFIGEDGIDTDKSVTPTMEVTESAIGEMSKGNAGVEPIAIETMTLSVAVEEVESVVGEESIEVVRSVIATLSDGKLEIERDGYGCVDMAKCTRQPAQILALAQFAQETRSWVNSCLVMPRMQQQPEVGKGWRELMLQSRSPPLYLFPYFQSLVNNLSRIMIRVRLFRVKFPQISLIAVLVLIQLKTAIFHIMFGKLLMICHCKCNKVEQSNRKAFGIATLGDAPRTLVRNDNCLTAHDIKGNFWRCPTVRLVRLVWNFAMPKITMQFLIIFPKTKLK